MKKVNINDNTPEKLRNTYERVDSETGEIFNVSPEYTTMSRRPGVGKHWYEKYKKDCYPSDFIVQNGQKMQPPKFYDSMYEDISTIKDLRKARAHAKRADNTPERLLVKEKCKQAQMKQLIRPLDKE